MSRNARIALVAAALVIVVAAFVVLRPGDEGATNTATNTSTQATTPPATSTAAARPRPEVATIRISGGEPVGGVRELRFKEGGTIRFRVTGQAEDEVHLHGYDIEEPVGPGKAASFSVPATITGRFEVELHESATPIAEVTVEP